MLVTAVADNDLTVLRARAHTLASAHANTDAVVKQINEQSYIETTRRD